MIGAWEVCALVMVGYCIGVLVGVYIAKREMA